MTLQNTDKFLVSRNDINQQVDAAALMSKLQDTDLMVVCRGDTPYKATGAEIKDSFGSPSINPGVNDITVTPSTTGDGSEANPFVLQNKVVTPFGGSTESNETITIIGQPPNAPVTWVNLSTDSGSRFTQISGETTDSSGVWTGTLDYADIPESTEDKIYIGTLKIGLVYFQWTISQLEVVNSPTTVEDVSLVKSTQSSERFTNQQFLAQTSVIDGIPTSVKTFDAHVDGTISKEVKFNEPLESVGVTTIDYASFLSNGGGGWYDGASSASAAFDGNQNTFAAATGSNSITWDTSTFPLAGKLSIKIDPTVTYSIKVSNAGGSATNNYPANTTSGIVDFPDWYTSITEVIVETPGSSGPAASIFAFYLDDQEIITGGSIGGDISLTFANGTDMEALAGGDTVNQTSDFTEPLESLGSTPGPAYSTYLTTPPGFQGAGAVRGFDGDLNEPPYSNNNTSSTESPRITWDCSSYGFTDTDTVELWFLNTGSWVEFIDTSGTIVGGPIGNATPNTWWAPDTGTIPNLAAIRTYNKSTQAGGISSAWAAGVRVNGTILIDGQQPGLPKLNFANGTDMSALAAGDTVGQINSFTEPLESAISTGYVAATNTDSPNGYLPGYPASNAYDGNVLTKAITNTPGSNITVNLKGYPAFKNSTIKIYTSQSQSQQTITDDVGNTYTINTGGANIFYETTIGSDLPLITLQGINGSNAELNAISIDDVILVESSQLTFAGGTDMSTLAVGDVVSQATYSPLLTSSNGWLDPMYEANKAFGAGDGFNSQVNGEEGYATGNSNSVLTFDCSTLNLSGDIVWAGFVNNAICTATSDAGETVCTDIVGSNINWKYTFSGLTNVTKITLTSSGYPVCRGIKANGQILLDAAGTVGSITNTTATLSSSSGGWVNGEDVTTGDKTTTGTVGSIANTSATLSSSSGTWTDGLDVTTGDKTTSGIVSNVADTTASLSSSSGSWINGLSVVGPQKTINIENSRLYCVFGSDGIITDLQNDPQDPPYTTQDSDPELTLTFPSILPSGQTPDEELTEGTTLTVEVSAENSTSTSGPVSATILPNETTLRSQTTEEFVETTAKFISYDNRKQVKEGEKALENREDLQEELEKKGLTKDQITQLFND